MSLSSSTTRNLSLTEELEKLEQSITLTLQEIDHNFSKAHRIVTSGIIPAVERYAQHSDNVWEGSKFWKQFFEASANVSLTGYEEGAEQDATQADTTVTEHDTQFGTPLPQEDDIDGDGDGYVDGDDTIVSNRAGNDTLDDMEVSVLDSPFGAGGVQSTPQIAGAGSKTRLDSSATRRSQRTVPASRLPYRNRQSTDEPSTPRPQASTSTSRTQEFDSSPFEPLSARHNDKITTNTAQKKPSEPLLHRILDKNYRIQATPLKRDPWDRQATLSKDKEKTPLASQPSRTLDDLDSSPIASPEMPTLSIRHDLLSARLRTPLPRTPGVSVQRPMPATKTPGSMIRPAATAASTTRSTAAVVAREARTPALWDSDDDSFLDDKDEISVPKTINFDLNDPLTLKGLGSTFGSAAGGAAVNARGVGATVSQRGILQTPAREASRRIVEDILSTATRPYAMDQHDPNDTFFDSDGDANDDGGALCKTRNGASAGVVRSGAGHGAGQHGLGQGEFLDEFEHDHEDDDDDDDDHDDDDRFAGLRDDYSPSIVRKAILDDDDAF